MKKRIISLVMIILCISGCLTGCKKEKTNSKKIVLNEVAHSIFYAPQYVAIELGYFKDEGIELVLETGFGADKTMTALISGNADIGFMGSESSIYAYVEGAGDYAVNFAGLTQRAGNFLVSRTPIEDFSWDMIKEKNVIGGRKGGMPQMVLEYILKKNNIDPEKDVNIEQNIDFGLTAGAFSGDTKYDFTVEFEPGATALEKEGKGYVVASLGVDSGYVPYTSYCAKKSYIEKNKELILSFNKAINRGLQYVATHSSEEIAKVIAPQFADTDIETIATIVERYKKQDTWKESVFFEKKDFELLEDILIEAGELKEKVPYEDLVVNP